MLNTVVIVEYQGTQLPYNHHLFLILYILILMMKVSEWIFVWKHSIVFLFCVLSGLNKLNLCRILKSNLHLFQELNKLRDETKVAVSMPASMAMMAVSPSTWSNGFWIDQTVHLPTTAFVSLLFWQDLDAQQQINKLPTDPGPELPTLLCRSTHRRHPDPRGWSPHQSPWLAYSLPPVPSSEMSSPTHSPPTWSTASCCRRWAAW